MKPKLNFDKVYCANYIYDGDTGCTVQCSMCEEQDIKTE